MIAGDNCIFTVKSVLLQSWTDYLIGAEATFEGLNLYIWNSSLYFIGFQADELIRIPCLYSKIEINENYFFFDTKFERQFSYFFNLRTSYQSLKLSRNYLNSFPLKNMIYIRIARVLGNNI